MKLDVIEVVVKPKSGKNTRLQNYKKKKDGRPDMQPTEDPKITKSKGDRLRVSATKKVGKNDIGNGFIDGADDRSYLYVTDDPTNGKAAKHFVKRADVEILRFGEMYTVKQDDNLTKIAKKVYSSGKDKYVDLIYNANKHVIGKDKDKIYKGQMLLIPYKVS